jgi:hypothetical protein
MRPILLTVLAATAASLLTVPVDARSRCQYFNDGREPLCFTTSDGANDPYIDGRDRSSFSWHDRMERMRRDRQAREDEGRSQWRNDGTPSSVGTISPFVPGSDQDRAWRAERARRGM